MIRVYSLKGWDIVSNGEGKIISILSKDYSDMLQEHLGYLLMESVGKMPSKKRKNGCFLDEYDKQYKQIKFKKIKIPINEFLTGGFK